jgi:hypothetical protein
MEMPPSCECATYRPTSAKSGGLVCAAWLVALTSTVLNMIWNASWLHNGGSPHGMAAGPGLWQILGPFLVWTFAAATALSFFGKAMPDC